MMPSDLPWGLQRGWAEGSGLRHPHRVGIRTEGHPLPGRQLALLQWSRPGQMLTWVKELEVYEHKNY